MKQLIFLIGLLLICPSVWATNFGSSIDDESASITFSHTSDLDSVHAWFGYDGDGSGADSSNLYYWKKLLPCFGNDKIAMADNVVLDSVGTHVVKIVYWPIDGSDSIATGIWLHQGAGAALSAGVIASHVKDTATIYPGIWTDEASGSGGELCSLLTKDSNGQAVSGLTWTVRDSTGNDLGTDNTNAAGWALFNIDQHDSVHLYPKERAGISLAAYYAEPVPNNGFCDTITATIWNYTVAGGGMCNLHINTRDLIRRTAGYGRWKMTVEYSKPGGYTDTTGGFLQWGGMEETAFKDSGLLQISVPQTYRALLYDSVTDTYTDSGLVNIRIYREDNLIREFFKVNVPRDSTQYDVLHLMMK